MTKHGLNNQYGWLILKLRIVLEVLIGRVGTPDGEAS